MLEIVDLLYLQNQSQAKQHRFNKPYMLGNGCERDDVSSAIEGEVSGESGDIVVAATDGLLDNVFPSEIVEILNQADGKQDPEQLAKSIAEAAHFNSLDMTCESPFAKAAMSEAGLDISGGKYDDITVVVGQIQHLS